LTDYKDLPEPFAERHGHHCKRINNLVARSKTVRDDLLNDPLVHHICRKIYTERQRIDYWLGSAMVLEHSPGGKPGGYHRDQLFFPPCMMLGAAGPLALVNFFVALSDMTKENGGTRVIPGSHMWLDFSDHGNPDMSVPMEMKAGDACLLGGKTVHGSGENATLDSLRRMLILGFQAGFLTPFESTCLHVSREVVDSMTPLARKMIGWGSLKIDTTPTWTIDCGDPGLWLQRERKAHN
jgi:ectoine hydroxylase-related dioxygenase (phytanoyl-CoA dioxygenase family)